ncbi:DNA mismatch repair endonuclease MutL [Zavarzinella formosa]|uniref:DNA mismatch repair endonuclease MutL n=1 Tax=Zavarzinella formosa TaxID=360055 RepID=UPI00031BDA7F|nr:DNA mismatch repair endonuclease MutL [Zavarzinella formosa]
MELGTPVDDQQANISEFMPRIHQLPNSVITKIAAGEVIERPASVVKELLENSIDAGATRLDIELEQGGTELIRVVDDGHGIEAEDLPLVFASHATSKLSNADDLFRIGTLGFRGEAMSSIGGVGKVTIQSRPTGSASGASILCDGGDLSEVRPWNGSPGTRIEVKHLFFNTPVRKKFLKGIPTELGQVTETITRLALAYPSLHLLLKHNNRLVHEIPSSAGLADRLGLFFGKEVRENLIEVEAEAGGLELQGYITDPQCDRGNAKLQYLFVNGRWIRDRSLAHALQEAYRGLLMTGRYAIGFLFITIPPDQVDVNVHPTKSEVRFRDSSALYSLVRGGVKRALLSKNLLPKLQIPADEPLPETIGKPVRSPRFEQAAYTPAPWERMAPPPSPTLPPPAPTTFKADLPEIRPTPAPKEETLFTAPREFTPPDFPKSAEVPSPPPVPLIQIPVMAPPQRAIQIHDAYLIVETAQGMLVIDQHALHERILFEQLRRRILDGKLDVQRLLIPEPIDLTMEQATVVLDAKTQLAELGLEVEDFGGGTVAVSSYPALLSRIPVQQIFQSVVDELVKEDRTPSKAHVFHHLLATMACKAAVKAGDKLTTDEIDYLMQLRQMAEDSHHCPHGRPTSLTFSRHELDKQFKRI